jgi:hypothetical protein
MNINDISKAAYAAFLLREPDAFKAACLLCPEDTGKALWIATNWKNDPDVNDELDKLKSSPDSINTIGSKYEVALILWNIANNEILDTKDRMAAIRDFCTLRGIYDFNSKQGTTVNVDASSKVMIVKDHGEDNEWEKKVMTQQQELTSESYVSGSHKN